MITIKVSKKSVPVGGESVERYYGMANSNGRVELEQLAERISNMCTVTRSDIVAVLAGLQKQVIDTLRNGDGVSLGELGTIYVRCHSALVATEAECNTSTVKSLKVAFRPKRSLKKAVAKSKLKFVVSK